MSRGGPQDGRASVESQAMSGWSPLPTRCLTSGKSQAFSGSCFLICLIGGVIICTPLTQELVGPPLQ